MVDRVETAGRRVERFAEVSLSVWEMRHSYEDRMKSVIPLPISSYCATQVLIYQLLKNMEQVRAQWDTTSFDGTYSDAKHQSEQFNNYKRSQKRNYVAEKTDLEYLLGNIQTKVKTYGLRAYTPPQGLLLTDLDAAWRTLGKAEAQRSKAINAKIGGSVLSSLGIHSETSFRCLGKVLMFRIKEGLRRSFAEKANEFSLLLDTISLSITKFEGALEVAPPALPPKISVTYE